MRAQARRADGKNASGEYVPKPMTEAATIARGAGETYSFPTARRNFMGKLTRLI